MAYIKVSGTKLVDANGEELILRGAGLGGWMKCVCHPHRHARSLTTPLIAWRTLFQVRVLAIVFARSRVTDRLQDTPAASIKFVPLWQKLLARTSPSSSSTRYVDPLYA